MCNHLREYELHVHHRRASNVAPAADQVVLGVQVRIVVAKVMKAGKTSKDSIDGPHLLAPTAHPAWLGDGESKVVITSPSSDRDRVAALTVFAFGGDNGEMQLLAQRAADKATNRMGLPTGNAHNLL
jgi:hypothetical protein